MRKRTIIGLLLLSVAVAGVLWERYWAPPVYNYGHLRTPVAWTYAAIAALIATWCCVSGYRLAPSKAAKGAVIVTSLGALVSMVWLILQIVTVSRILLAAKGAAQ